MKHSAHANTTTIKRVAAAQCAVAGLGLAGCLINPVCSRVFLVAAFCAVAFSAISLLHVFEFVPLRPVLTSVRLQYIGARLLLVLLAGGALLLLFAVLLSPFKHLPSLWFYLPFILAWPWLAMATLLAAGSPDQHRAWRFFGTLLKLSLGTLIFFVFFEGLLQLGFNMLPGAVKYRMPQAGVRSGITYETAHGAREYPAGQIVDYALDGCGHDLFALTCLQHPDTPAPTPYRVTFTRDRHGFRNPTPWPDSIDLLVVGDSFTAGEAVQYPFTEGIAPSSLAFGLPDSGSLEQLQLLRALGLPRAPKVVVMAYFEGNDLVDTENFYAAWSQGENTYSHALPDLLPLEFLVSFRISHWLNTLNDTSCHYPIKDSLGNDLAFFDPFFTMSTLDADALRASERFSYTRDAILSAAEITQAGGATFVLAFLPYKAHAHWNLLGVERLDIIAQHNDTPGDFTARLTQNIDVQRRLLGELADDTGFLFLDMTPAFQEAAEAGAVLYFYGDTHWNQQGHDLARETLRAFLHKHDLIAGTP